MRVYGDFNYQLLTHDIIILPPSTSLTQTGSIQTLKNKDVKHLLLMSKADGVRQRFHSSSILGAR
jgi:hypothetical protein